MKLREIIIYIFIIPVTSFVFVSLRLIDFYKKIKNLIQRKLS
jgi:hypothetical protein